MVWSVHIQTEKNLADMMTKGLTAEVRGRLDKELIKLVDQVAKIQYSKPANAVCEVKKAVGLKKKGWGGLEGGDRPRQLGLLQDNSMVLVNTCCAPLGLLTL